MKVAQSVKFTSVQTLRLIRSDPLWPLTEDVRLLFDIKNGLGHWEMYIHYTFEVLRNQKCGVPVDNTSPSTFSPIYSVIIPLLWANTICRRWNIYN